MTDLSAVRGYIPQIEHESIDVVLLNIHTPPGSDMLTRFAFEFSPTYLVFDTQGAEVFRSNTLPTAIDVIQLAE